MKMKPLSMIVISFYVFLLWIIINRPNRVIRPPNIIYSFRIWPGNINQAMVEAINGSPKGMDATTVGDKYLTK